MEDARPHELLLLRHGKSSWSSSAATDAERPLAERGRRDAPHVGAWMGAHGLMPDTIVSSPAERAYATALLVAQALEIDEDAIEVDARIYEASSGGLVRRLREIAPDAHRVLLVGHNPGLEMLVWHLAARPPGFPPSGKLMPTCALAHLVLDCAWEEAGPGCADLVGIVRPKEIGAAHG